MCHEGIKQDDGDGDNDGDDDGDDDDDDTSLKYEAVLKFMQTLKAPSILKTSKTTKRNAKKKKMTTALQQEIFKVSTCIKFLLSL